MVKTENESLELRATREMGYNLYGPGISKYSPDFEGMVVQILNIFKSEYGSRMQYLLKYTAGSQGFLTDDRKSILKDLVHMQNRTAVALASLSTQRRAGK